PCPCPPPRACAPPAAIPLVGTFVLLATSAPTAWAEAGIRRGDVRRLAIGIGIAMALSAGFVVLQAIELTRKAFAPQTNAYGSAFFTITSFHGLHVIVALLL